MSSLRADIAMGLRFFFATRVSNSTRSNTSSLFLPETATKNLRGSLLGVTLISSPGVKMVTSISVTAAMFAPGKRARPIAR